MLNWRKLAAWGLVFSLSAFVAIKLVISCGASDIPNNVVELVKWVTGFFFGANAVEHISKRFDVQVKK